MRTSRLFILLALLCTIYGCQSNETKANKLISDYMFNHLHDFKSYEAVETKVDTLFNTISDDPTCRRIASSASALVKQTNEYSSESERLARNAQFYSGINFTEFREELEEWRTNKRKEYTSMIEFLKCLKSIQESSKGLDGRTRIGWRVKHKYRCNTLGGNSKLSEETFFIDKDFKSILEAISDKSLVDYMLDSTLAVRFLNEANSIDDINLLITEQERKIEILDTTLVMTYYHNPPKD